MTVWPRGPGERRKCCLWILAQIYFLSFRVSHNVPRAIAFDILPPIDKSSVNLFINLEDENVSWKLFLDPISTKSWLIIIIISATTSSALLLIERLHFGSVNQNCLVLKYLENFWVAIKANLGGKPSSILNVNSHKIIILFCLLGGSIVWMHYRASFTSHLSIAKFKLPFNDLESFSQSDYK